MAKYEIEVWSKDGKPMGDIRHFCSNLSWSKTLNDAESVSFNIDLTYFEKFLKNIGYTDDPFGFFEVGRSDIRIKRNGAYLLGANVIKFTYSSSYASVTMQVSASGYLTYYKYRYFTGNFSQVPQGEILWRIIDQLNQQTGGDYGVRQGKTDASVLRDRSYDRKEVKSLFTQMSEVIDGPDFDFDFDKHLNTYAVKGTYRPSVRVNYPGNIQSFTFSRSCEKVSNFVYGIGSGNGDDAVSVTAEDVASENYLYRREKVATWNSVTDANTLAQHADSVVHYTKDIIELPSVTLRDGAIDLSEVDVGDTIVLNFDNLTSMKHISGNYRIQKISCNVDDNDSESTTLNFDDIDIDKIIQNQQEE